MSQEKLSWVCPNPDCKAKNLADTEKFVEAIGEKKDVILVCANCGFAQRIDYRLANQLRVNSLNLTELKIKLNICNKYISSKCLSTLCISELFQDCMGGFKIENRDDFINKYGIDPVIHNKFIEKNLKQRGIKNFKYNK